MAISSSTLCFDEIISISWKMSFGSSSSPLLFQGVHFLMRYALDLIGVALFPDIDAVIRVLWGFF